MPATQAEFGMSPFGRGYLVAEYGPLPPLRIAFVAITLASGVLATFHVASAVRRLLHLIGTSRTSAASGAWAIFIVAYFLHLWIHVAHFADNIYRPADYLEPVYLYRAYLLETMEITFAFNLPVCFLGATTAAGLADFYGRTLLEIGASSPRELAGLTQRVLLYASASILTLLHYATAPPWYFSGLVNFTIGGEGAAMVGLAAAVLFLNRRLSDDTRQGTTRGHPADRYELVPTTTGNANDDREPDEGASSAALTAATVTRVSSRAASRVRQTQADDS
ncbi:hypothetical protein HK405_012794 [Cladochytrium tenue]|nr:hypothetical protein HK405_012794 [Cladochytrium tenue]